MGALVAIEHGLTPTQIAAARLDAAGLKPSKIAKKIGVVRETISRWRSLPLYQQTVRAIMADLDAAVLMDARRLRERALAAVTSAVRKAEVMLEAPDLTPADAVRLGAHCLDVYRAVSAQTGLLERSGVEHLVALDPREAIERIVLAIRDTET